MATVPLDAWPSLSRLKALFLPSHISEYNAAIVVRAVANNLLQLFMNECYEKLLDVPGIIFKQVKFLESPINISTTQIEKFLKRKI